MDDTIKFFSEYELQKFFGELEKRRFQAKTDYALSIAIRNEALFKVMYYCALRASEACIITPEDFNPINNQIYCRRLKGGINNTLRIMDDDVLRSLKRHLRFNRPEQFLFENQRDHKELSRKTLDRIMKSCCKDAHMKSTSKWHCHTLRHTRAIILAESGFDVKELQYWLGHTEISNTMVYFRFTAKQQETMYRKIKKAK